MTASTLWTLTVPITALVEFPDAPPYLYTDMFCDFCRKHYTILMNYGKWKLLESKGSQEKFVGFTCMERSQIGKRRDTDSRNFEKSTIKRYYNY